MSVVNHKYLHLMLVLLLLDYISDGYISYFTPLHLFESFSY